MRKDGWHIAPKEIMDEVSERTLALKTGILVIVLTIIWGCMSYKSSCIFVNVLFNKIITGKKISIDLWLLIGSAGIGIFFVGLIYSIRKIKEYIRIRQGKVWVRTVVLEKSITLKVYHGTHYSEFFSIGISYKENGKKVYMECPYDGAYTSGYLEKIEGTEITVATSNFHHLIVLKEVYPEMR